MRYVWERVSSAAKVEFPIKEEVPVAQRRYSLSLSPSLSQHSFGSKCCQAVWHGLLRSALRFGVFVVVFLKFRFRSGEMCRAHVQPACLLTTKNNGNK